MLTAFAACLPYQARAAEATATGMPFRVDAIEVRGLQRVSEGTVYNYLPVNIGDVIETRQTREALRALIASGFFRDVSLYRDAGTLVVQVKEKPTISSFEIAGNKEIKTEDLTKSLRGIGLAAGKFLDRSTLQNVELELQDQYFSRGRYSASIKLSVTDEPDNRASVAIAIREGERARVRQISIAGTSAIPEAELLEALSTRTPNWLSWYRQDDRYSREAMQGDIEKLRTHYQDRGYADFEIVSAQVQIAPEKNDVFVNFQVAEGPRYTVSGTKVAGQTKVPASELERMLLLIEPGQIYSQERISMVQRLMENRLGAEGYAFAKIDVVPARNTDDQTVALTFLVDPGQRVYVRRIEFKGMSRTADDAMRREMRQVEGAWVSNALIERSRQRLERLPYLKEVKVDTERVDGANDLVDVIVRAEDAQASQLSGGIGYSANSAFSLNGSFVDANFFGTGQRVSLQLDGGAYSKVFSLTHLEPYVSIDELSRSISLSYSELDRLTSSYSKFSTRSYALGTTFGYPITDWQRVSLGAIVRHEDMTTFASSSVQIRDWIRHNGNYYYRRAGNDALLGTLLDTVELTAGWQYENRNRALFPTRGGSYRLSAGIAPPGLSASYATLGFDAQQFFRLPGPDFLDRFPMSLSMRAGWVTALGDSTAPPPNRHIFTGGPDTVRGFREGTLGPRDSLGNPYGGDAGLSTQLEMVLPLPEKFGSSARLSLFVDAGQSFFLGDTEFRSKQGGLMRYGFDPGEFRASSGISVQWLAPLGLFRFSYALPLRYQTETRRLFGDETERFQFSVGTAF